MRVTITISTICLLLLATSPASAAGFARVGTFAYQSDGLFASGRISAMGGSDLSDGSPAALLINVAPLAQGNGVELSYDHANYISDLDFHTYAGAAEWKALRLNVAVQEFVAEGQPVRTAYNPEGTGETFDSRDRQTIIGLSYDLGYALFKVPSLSWSFGAAWHKYSTHFDDDILGEGDSVDLATTIRWYFDYDGGWTSIAGAVSSQNATAEKVTFDERQSELPNNLNTGFTVATAVDWSGHQGNLFKLTLAYSKTHQRRSYTFRDDPIHLGLETLLFDAVAVRYGHSTRVTDNIESWGVGLILDDRLLGPFTLAVDMGEMQYGDQFGNAKKTIWGARARYNF